MIYKRKKSPGNSEGIEFNPGTCGAEREGYEGLSYHLNCDYYPEGIRISSSQCSQHRLPNVVERLPPSLPPLKLYVSSVHVGGSY